MRALLFDFDGLILDTETPLLRTWAEMYRHHGQELDPARFHQVVGSADHFDPVAELETLTGLRLDRESTQREIRARYLGKVAAEPVRPGVRERISEARSAGLLLGVASSSSREWVAGNLERVGLGPWDCLRCRGEAARAKPHPELYLSLLDCLGLGAAQAIAIEDSANGILAAKRAGLWCLAVPNPTTAGLDLSRADHQVASLAELTLAEILTLAAGR